MMPLDWASKNAQTWRILRCFYNLHVPTTQTFLQLKRAGGTWVIVKCCAKYSLCTFLLLNANSAKLSNYSKSI